MNCGGIATSSVWSSLKFALYWSKWNLWSLVSCDRFQNSSSNYLELPFVEAIQYNEMGIVGDRTPGTEWPIGFKVYTDPSEPRHVTKEGEAVFTVGHAEYVVNDKPVLTALEQEIVHRLMLYGGWEEEATAEIVNGELLSVSFLFSPEGHAERTEEYR